MHSFDNKLAKAFSIEHAHCENLQHLSCLNHKEIAKHFQLWYLSNAGKTLKDIYEVIRIQNPFHVFVFYPFFKLCRFTLNLVAIYMAKGLFLGHCSKISNSLFFI